MSVTHYPHLKGRYLTETALQMASRASVMSFHLDDIIYFVLPNSLLSLYVTFHPFFAATTIEGEKLQLIFILIACTVALNALLSTPTPVTHNLLSRVLAGLTPPRVIIHRCSDISPGLLSGKRSSSSSVTILGSEYSWFSATLSEMWRGDDWCSSWPSLDLKHEQSLVEDLKISPILHNLAFLVHIWDNAFTNQRQMLERVVQVEEDS